MAVDKSYERLGVFLVVAVAVVIGTGLFFFERWKRREVIDLVTYTTGNVSGLDVGSPVRYRGVPLGRVEDLRIEPRGSLVEVDFDVLVDRLSQRGASVDRIRQEARSDRREARELKLRYAAGTKRPDLEQPPFRQPKH